MSNSNHFQTAHSYLSSPNHSHIIPPHVIRLLSHPCQLDNQLEIVRYHQKQITALGGVLGVSESTIGLAQLVVANQYYGNCGLIVDPFYQCKVVLKEID
jgi:hypothetical protein